jgi:phage head maturation protease
MHNTITFTAAEFAVDKESRTLSGVLLPFGEVSRPAADPTTGATARFFFADASKIALPEDPSDVVLNYAHDKKSLYMQVGVATELTPQDKGVLAKFKIARTPEGDRVLALAEDRILKSFSAEVEGEFEARKDGVQDAKATTLTGAAVVKVPAFAGAHITSVAASAAPNEEEPMGDTKVGADETVAFTKAEGEALMAKVEAQAAEIAQLKDIKIPVGPGTAQFEVKEEPIYRFAGSEPAPSGFDFATDLLAAGKDGDAAALARLQKFTAEQMAPQFVTTADVNEANPSQYRPDMFLGQAPTPQSPLYDTFYKGSLTNVTPFFWSKLDRVATTAGVADHVEGTEPTATNLVTAVGTTVTPTAVSGRVHITREVADQGGNPVVSGLVRAEFDRSFKIALETKTAGLLSAAAASVTSLTAAIAAGATGLVAGQAIEAGLIDVQFLADGFRFTKMFGHVDLYKALASYENADGEKRYPIINPQNRSGISGDKYSFIDIAGYRMNPGTSLGATSTAASNSWLVDPSAVHVWASGLTRLDKLQEKVEGWDMGVFAYFAGVVYDVTGLRKIAYDPAP